MTYITSASGLSAVIIQEMAALPTPSVAPSDARSIGTVKRLSSSHQVSLYFRTYALTDVAKRVGINEVV